ncbi:hybrid sensor histidine kinase/response regulator [Stenomitos frigidus]|uniref:histidine kinase n=1 Tax=Stenomitos frigidus ULC18 TaxID=2107698 RepID=A0A2T1EJL9_9CYAN|nr:hybrid sensor histidine kinase/response regulator [Stenomitos frigidus]PSB32946.1 histidine kinase [Stenomitos frigidus ULC18]
MNNHREATTKKNILVVDDRPDNLRLLEMMLSQHGYEVRKVLNGSLAIKVAQAFLPDLILLDIRMAAMDGYEVCQQLKASPQTREIPVIFLSALDNVIDKVKAFQVGGVDYITKPFQVEEVLARVEHQLTIRTLQQQLQQHSLDLEAQVQTHTAQLQLAFDFEATLKRITDRVRDSLDENQILQAAVQELAIALGVRSCNAALYNLEQHSATVSYEYAASLAPIHGRVLRMDNFAEGYRQLLQGQYFQFCSLLPNAQRGRVVMLACPIVDDQGVLGDLWLVSPCEYVFTEQDIRLVQQVVNQCAIALRQSRLYQALQTQVNELEQLNRLKDDFLSTVSHELRTPMANIKMAIHMLEISLKNFEPPGAILEQPAPAPERLQAQPQNEPPQAKPNTQAAKVDRYLQILQDECQREIDLITDLLDLTRLDAEVEPPILAPIELATWLPIVAEPFVDRAHSQQQQLHVDIAPALPTLTTEQASLERILAELLNNACKYTPPGASIVLAAHKTTDRLQISVINGGAEISKQEQARIFDKFYRIPNHDPWKRGGTGLGLALVKKLAARLGASICVESTKETTTFMLQFPFADDTLQDGREQAPTDPTSVRVSRTARRSNDRQP